VHQGAFHVADRTANDGRDDRHDAEPGSGPDQPGEARHTGRLSLCGQGLGDGSMRTIPDVEI